MGGGNAGGYARQWVKMRRWKGEQGGVGAGQVGTAVMSKVMFGMVVVLQAGVRPAACLSR